MPGKAVPMIDELLHEQEREALIFNKKTGTFF